MPTLEEQMWTAQAEVRRLQDAIKAQQAAELQARVDAACAVQESSPDPHALLMFIDELLWDGPADEVRGAISVVLNRYFVALDAAVAA